MPQFDFANVFVPQLVWLALFFAVLYFGVVRLTLPKLGAVMENREAKIVGDLSAAQAAKQSADEVGAAYQAEMDASREDARKAIAQAKAEAAKASEASLAKAGEAADARIAQAEARIAKAAAAAQASLRDAAAQSAQAIVTKLTGVEPKLDAAKASIAAQF